jgi:site-specific recombinase XerD
MAEVGDWLSERELGPSELLSSARVDELLQDRRAEGAKTFLSRRALVPLTSYLMSQGAVLATSAQTGSPTETLVQEYGRVLLDERGLSKGTIANYLRVARLFLSECCHLDDGEDLQQLTARQVSGFVVEQCRQRHSGSAQVLVTGLRSLLRFLFAAHYISHQLSGAVPTPSGFAGGSLPHILDDDMIEALLASCERRNACGRRDFAMLTVLARLCLRAGEVATLLLDDLDWRHGEIVVRGKGGRRERMPLPVDVGEALVAYLSDGRPSTTCRSLFLRSYAPITGLTSSAVSMVVHRACLRAGVTPAGPHRMRHHGASAMLRNGATLSDVGHVLRHLRVATTSVYAKVDRVALAALGQPWPTGVR